MNKDWTPDSVFMLYFGVAVGVCVVQETGRYCQHYLDTSDSAWQHSEMLLCLAIIVQMGRYILMTVLEQIRQCLAALNLKCCFVWRSLRTGDST